MRFFLSNPCDYHQKSLWTPERTRYVVIRANTPFYIKVFDQELTFRDALKEMVALTETMILKRVPRLFNFHPKKMDHHPHDLPFHLQEIGKLKQGSVVVDMSSGPHESEETPSIETYDSKLYKWVATCEQNEEKKLIHASILVPADALVRKDEYILI